MRDPPEPLTFGRKFYTFELLAALSRVDGVRDVSLILSVDGVEAPGPLVQAPPDALLWSAAEHTVKVSPEPARATS